MKTCLFTGLISALALSAAASAQDVERNFDEDGFDRIDLSGQFEVRIEIGEGYAIQMSGDADDMDRVRVETENGELRIRTRNRWFGNSRDLDVMVVMTMPRIDAAELSRGVEASLSGVDAERFDLEVSTGAYAQVTGRCGYLDAEVSTGGALRARNLICERVDAEASTGADADLTATQRIDAEASTGGDLDIFGSPASRSFESSFGGSVRFQSGS